MDGMLVKVDKTNENKTKCCDLFQNLQMTDGHHIFRVYLRYMKNEHEMVSVLFREKGSAFVVERLFR